MPVKGCCALTQRLSDSLHSNSGKPVIQRNFHCDLSITPSASPNCKRNCPAISAAASVPLISPFADTATTRSPVFAPQASATFFTLSAPISFSTRSEEHTSELQSHLNLVCRLLLEKKKQNLAYIY